MLIYLRRSHKSGPAYYEDLRQKMEPKRPVIKDGKPVADDNGEPLYHPQKPLMKDGKPVMEPYLKKVMASDVGKPVQFNDEAHVKSKHGRFFGDSSDWKKICDEQAAKAEQKRKYIADLEKSAQEHNARFKK